MITSRQNQTVKRLKALKDKKYRDECGEYLAEGKKSVSEALLCGAEVRLLALTPDNADFPADGKIPREILSFDVFSSVSGEVSPEGVIAVVAKPFAKPEKTGGRAIFLDGVSDPANVGAIIRNAACFGYGKVFIADGADAYSPKAVRASMGGIFRVKVFSGKREDLIPYINIPFVVADMGGERLSQINGDFCLVIGSEAHGVSQEMRSLAKKTVAIPMENGMESLNAAVSAGIIMFTLKKN